MKNLWKKIKIYIKPFINWRFLVAYFIPFMLINGWAWIGFALMPVIGSNWYTIASTTWLGILWLPCTPEKLITIPMAIFIHTKLFGPKDPKTREDLDKLYSEAKSDWQTIKSKFKKNKE